MTPVRLESAAPRSRVKHSTTEPLRSHGSGGVKELKYHIYLGQIKKVPVNRPNKKNTCV